jgi:endoglucanase
VPSPASRLRSGFRRSPGRVFLVAAILIAVVVTALNARPGSAPGSPGVARSPAGAGRGLPAGTRLYVPPAAPDAAGQVARLRDAGRSGDAALIGAMESVPRAMWLTGGTPADVREKVRAIAAAAGAAGTVPVLVAYNIPGRDCGHYSAGGTADLASYAAWTDGLAAGLGQDKAIVLVEPDALGSLPSGCGRPAAAAGFTDADRFAELRYAVSAVQRDPRAAVYLTASAWASAATMTRRLLAAGVGQARGFFLNVSDFEPTPQVIEYGTWVSECIAIVSDSGNPLHGNPGGCASQYSPATASDYGTWQLTSDWYARHLDGAVPVTHFVIDTSRNGQGYDSMRQYADPPYNQPSRVIAGLTGSRWCNPPGAGLGLRPTVSTRVPLVDAYLWVKTPGFSDGQCDAAGGARTWDYASYTGSGWPGSAQARSHFDPLWGGTDPPAGGWFPAQALRLARQASPPLG